MRFVRPAVGMIVVGLLGVGCGGSPSAAARITMAKPCVSVGDTQRIDTKTASKASVAYAIVYSDGLARSTEAPAPAGRADEDGRFTGEWAVPAGVPMGKVNVEVLVAAGSKTSRNTVSFVIAEPAECASTIGDGSGSTTPGASGSSASTTATASQSTSSTSPPTTTAGAGSGSTTTAPPYPVTVKLEKPCVNAAGSQRLTVSSKPSATVAYVVLYADGRTHENQGGGMTDGKGTFEDRFVLDPTVPSGNATVRVSVNWNGTGSSGTADFRVGGC